MAETKLCRTIEMPWMRDAVLDTVLKSLFTLETKYEGRADPYRRLSGEMVDAPDFLLLTDLRKKE